MKIVRFLETGILLRRNLINLNHTFHNKFLLQLAFGVDLTNLIIGICNFLNIMKRIQLSGWEKKKRKLDQQILVDKQKGSLLSFLKPISNVDEASVSVEKVSEGENSCAIEDEPAKDNVNLQSSK